jgi:hypothetical protein
MSEHKQDDATVRHLRDRVVAAFDLAEEACVEEPTPLARLELFDLAKDGAARAGHQDVDALDTLEQGPHLMLVADVGGDATGAPAEGRISISGVCKPMREGEGRREMVPPELVGDPRVGDSTIPNERRHRWNGTSGWTRSSPYGRRFRLRFGSRSAYGRYAKLQRGAGEAPHGGTISSCVLLAGRLTGALDGWWACRGRGSLVAGAGRDARGGVGSYASS